MKTPLKLKPDQSEDQGSSGGESIQRQSWKRTHTPSNAKPDGSPLDKMMTQSWTRPPNNAKRDGSPLDKLMTQFWTHPNNTQPDRSPHQ